MQFVARPRAASVTAVLFPVMNVVKFWSGQEPYFIFHSFPSVSSAQSVRSPNSEDLCDVR